MKTSSKTGTAFISIGAGIIPALFVSCVATACLAAWLWVIGDEQTPLLPIPDQQGFFIGLALEYSTYGAIALLIHALSIWTVPSLNWTRRAALYAVFGGVLGASFLRVQFGLSGLTFESISAMSVHIMVILGGLTALITYAAHGIMLYAVKRVLASMEL